MPRTSEFVYDVWQKQNPGSSGNDDLDGELFAAQAEDEDEDEDEEQHHHDVDIIVDYQVGFFTHHHKGDIIDN